MKIKKLLLVFVAFMLSFTLMGCPKVQNQVPQFVLDVNGQLEDVNHITYEHVQGTAFDPDQMVQNLIDNQGLMAIDYDQSKVIWGIKRDYFNISDQIEVTSFYQIWTDGEDVNGDGVIDATDEALWGTVKTDQDGNKLYDDMKIFLLSILGVGQTMDFTLSVTDSEGATTELSGTIEIIAPAQ